MPEPAVLRHDPAREEQELRDYLGDAYDVDKLVANQELLDAEAAEAADEATLYRTSHSYLYNLTAFAMSGTKLPYLRALTRLVPPEARLLDYGCGLGSDGLLLIEAGYRVEFADFDNPSTEFLRWRLAQRGLDAPVHDLDRGVPDGFDAAYAFDVIEHVPDPHALLGEMERRAALVAVNLLEFEPHKQELHYELPIRKLLLRAAKGKIELYRVYYGSSHLIVYRPAAAPVSTRAMNYARLAAGRIPRPAS